MKVRDIIEALSKYPEDLDVLLSLDEEGNGFSDASDIGEYYVERDDPYYDSIRSEGELTEYDEEDVEDLFKKVLVFWP